MTQMRRSGGSKGVHILQRLSQDILVVILSRNSLVLTANHFPQPRNRLGWTHIP